MMMVTGVGQTLRFASGQMEDVLHLADESGHQISVSISNEDARRLVELIMGNGQSLAEVDEPSSEVVCGEGTVFGGDAGPPQHQISSVNGNVDLFPELDRPSPMQADHKRQNKLGASIADKASARAMDRSGILSRTLPTSMVDVGGNPILPSIPDYTIDDEDDPGEQI